MISILLIRSSTPKTKKVIKIILNALKYFFININITYFFLIHIKLAIKPKFTLLFGEILYNEIDNLIKFISLTIINYILSKLLSKIQGNLIISIKTFPTNATISHVFYCTTSRETECTIDKLIRSYKLWYMLSTLYLSLFMLNQINLLYFIYILPLFHSLLIYILSFFIINQISLSLFHLYSIKLISISCKYGN